MSGTVINSVRRYLLVAVPCAWLGVPLHISGMWLELAGDYIIRCRSLPLVGCERVVVVVCLASRHQTAAFWISACIFSILQESQLTDVSKHTAFLGIAAPALHLVW